ncbi:MAG: hypothetical protein ACI376_05215 [Candidatus Bruticola sp.]
MSNTSVIVLCDQDSAIGDLLFCTLQNLAGKIIRLKGRSSQLASYLLDCRADLLVVNGNAQVGELLHIMRCCKAKYPNQKQILLTAVFEGYLEQFKEAQLDGLIFKPFKVGQLRDMASNLLLGFHGVKLNTPNYVVSRLEQLCQSKISSVVQYLKAGLDIVKTIWRHSYLKELEDERLMTLKAAYNFCLSKFSCYRSALKLWNYLEFLERHYLLVKGGADIESAALKFHYTMLKSKLERGIQGQYISVGEGDGFGPRLDPIKFSRFYERLRSQEVKFSCFHLAAQARLVHWACSRLALPLNGLKIDYASRRCLERQRYLSRKFCLAEAEAELKFLAAASEPDLQEIFRQVWI